MGLGGTMMLPIDWILGTRGMICVVDFEMSFPIPERGGRLDPEGGAILILQGEASGLRSA